MGTPPQVGSATPRIARRLLRAGARPAPERWLPLLLAAGLVFIGTGATVLSRAAALAPTAALIGGNYPVNEGASDPLDISAHNSPTVVQNPVDPTNLAISNRIDSPLFSCALHVSFDGGATWAQEALPVPKGEEPKCYAPEVAFSSDGTLYLSFVTLKGLGNVPNAVWIVSSQDGGQTLSRPRRALGPLSFQVRLTASPSKPDHLQLTWLSAETTATLAFPETGNPIMWATSEDGGATWSEPARVSDPRRERVVAPSPAVMEGDRAWILFLDLGDDRLDYAGAHQGLGGPPYKGYWSLVLARTDDGGRTWSESVVDERLVPTERFVVFIPPFPSLAVAPGGERIYAAFHDGRNGDADVRLWWSKDEGRTFSDPVRVNDTEQGDGTSQHLPQLDVAPDGRVDVIYLDRRDDPADGMSAVSLQSSFDGGKTFSRHVAVSDRVFDSRIGVGSERGMPSLGSRLGLLSVDETLLAVWADTRRGTVASSRQDLVRAIVAVRPPPLAPSVQAVLSTGGGAALAGGLLIGGYQLWQERRRRSRQAKLD